MNDRGARGEEYERKAEVTVEGGGNPWPGVDN